MSADRAETKSKESGVNVIAVGRNGWVETAPALKPLLRAGAYGFFRQWWVGVTYFHRDGQHYTVAAVRPPRRLGMVDRILASTVYNPALDFTVEYAPEGRYSMPQLRDALSAAIEQDDDSLTQFHEADELLARLRSATSFDEVLGVIEFAETPEETEE